VVVGLRLARGQSGGRALGKQHDVGQSGSKADGGKLIGLQAVAVYQQTRSTTVHARFKPPATTDHPRLLRTDVIALDTRKATTANVYRRQRGLPEHAMPYHSKTYGP